MDIIFYLFPAFSPFHPFLTLLIILSLPVCPSHVVYKMLMTGGADSLVTVCTLIEGNALSEQVLSVPGRGRG